MVGIYYFHSGQTYLEYISEIWMYLPHRLVKGSSRHSEVWQMATLKMATKTEHVMLWYLLVAQYKKECHYKWFP